MRPLLLSEDLLYSPTDQNELLLRFWAQTAATEPQLVDGEESQSFNVYLTLLSLSIASHL